MIDAVTSWLGPTEWQAVRLSLWVGLVATLVSLPLGILTAYALARWSFPGKQILNGIVHLPLILPPVVTGYLLLLSFGRRGPVGQRSGRSARHLRRLCGNRRQRHRHSRRL